MDTTNLTDEELVALSGRTTDELRRRGLAAPRAVSIGDLAETLVVERLGLRRAPASTAGYDAEAEDGARYQVKARRLGTAGDRQLGVIRNIDRRAFHFLVVVLFPPESDVPEGMWQIPFDVVREKARYNEHQNGHVLFATDAVLADERVERLVETPTPQPLPRNGFAEDTGPERAMSEPEHTLGHRHGHDRGNQAMALRDLVRQKAAERLRLDLLPNSRDGHNALDADGKRYLIRSRSYGSAGERELSAIKNIDQRRFDYLVFALVDRVQNDFQMWRLPFDFVHEHAKYDHANKGYVLFATDSLLADPRVDKL